MNYEVRITKNAVATDITDEQFESAIACAKDSVESVLFDDAVSVELNGNRIKIELTKEQPMTKDRLKDKLKGCFQDSNGVTYSEFVIVEIDQQC